MSLALAPGKGAYPIVNFEYAIVNARQLSAEQAAELRDFLSWIVAPSGGNAESYLSHVHFVPLPPRARNVSSKQIAQIQGP